MFQNKPCVEGVFNLGSDCLVPRVVLHGAYSMHRENVCAVIMARTCFSTHPPTQRFGYGGSVVVTLAVCVEEVLTTCRQFVDARFCE